MSELDELRREINNIDTAIIAQFEKRMEYAIRIAQYKYEHDLPIIDAVREGEVIKKAVGLISNKNMARGAEILMNTIMQLSRDVQADIITNLRLTKTIVYQGEPGANSQAALHKFFGKDANSLAMNTFEDVFEAVESGQAEFGVVPIENTSTGGITQIYDLLGSRPVFIVGEQKIPITHSILGVRSARIEDIKNLYSHEQAFLQCSEYLRRNDYNLHPYFNTATSAKYISELKDIKNGAIADPYAASIYGLDILQENISNKKDNMTRFIVISRSEYLNSDANKASIIFSLPHRPGSLSDILNVFARNGLNMVKIESRPMENKKFRYLFYIDFEGSDVIDSIKKVLCSYSDLFENFKLLGAYKMDLDCE